MIESVAVSRSPSAARGEAPLSTTVAERVAESLKASGYAALHSVVCQHRAGVLVLQGRVPSFYMKQLAQVLASKVPGVDVIVNRLIVADAAGGRQSFAAVLTTGGSVTVGSV